MKRHEKGMKLYFLELWWHIIRSLVTSKFCLHPGTQCCPGELNRIMPNFVARMWLKDKDNKRNSLVIKSNVGAHLSFKLLKLIFLKNVMERTVSSYRFEWARRLTEKTKMSTLQEIKCLGMVVLVFGFMLLINSYSGAEEKGLVGYWKFDEGKGSIAKDSSGMGNDGKIYGAAWTKGVFGSALKFDGTKSYVDCGSDASLNLTSALTIDAWVKVDNYSGGAYNIISDKSLQIFRFKSSGQLEFHIYDEDDKPYVPHSVENIPFNEWVHITTSYDSSSGRVYFSINGVRKLSTCNWPPAGKKLKSVPSIAFRLAKQINDNNKAFNGIIDDVRIYNRVLSQGEILAHYEKGKPHIASLKPKQNLREINPRIELVARKDYKISPYWSLKKTLDKDFWFLLPPLNKSGVKEEEFIKESGYVLSSGSIFPKPFALFRICLREIEIFDKKGKNIAPKATFSFSSPPTWHRLERLNDNDLSFSKPAYSSLPSKTPFKNIYIDLEFGRVSEIKEIALYQGFKRSPSEKTVSLMEHFAFQFLEDGKWKNIIGTEVKENRSEMNRFTFSPIRTEKLRLLIYDAGGKNCLPYKMSSLSLPVDRPFYLKGPGRYESGIYNWAGYITYSDFLRLGGENYFLDHEDYKRWKEKYKEHFLGFWFPEWGNDMRYVIGNSKKNALGIMLSDNKKDNCKAVEAHYKLFKSAHFDDIFGMNCNFNWDHYNLEWGGNLAAIEITGCGNPSHQNQIMFARGAARQYSTPWLMYQAYWWGNEVPDNSKGMVYWKKGVYITGPLAGIPISLARRDAYLCYMSGVNFFTAEDYPNAHIQDYDKDGIYELTKHGETLKELFEFSRRCERGVNYTPVAFLLDYYHGWFSHWPKKVSGRWSIWYNLPLQKGDFMLEEVMRAICPGFKLSNNRYGDIFDVLIPNPPSGTISEKILSGYKVLIPLGDIEIDKNLAQRLIHYVREGGTLVLNSSQVDMTFFPQKFLGVNLEKEIKKGKTFDYFPVETLTAKPLLKDGGGRVLITINKFGKGNLILTTPSYCLNKKKKLLPFFTQLLSKLTKEVLPFEIKGDIEYLINKNEEGEWLITLINNKGIRKDMIKLPADLTDKNPIDSPKNLNPETFDLSKTATVFIYPHIPQTPKNVVELITGKEISPKKEGMIEVKVPPGDIRIIRIETKERKDEWSFSEEGDSSLVGYWPFEEIKKAITPDASGKGNHAKLFGARQVEGRFGKGLYFDGNSSYVFIAPSESVLPADAVTYSAWIKPDTLGGTIMVANKDGDVALILTEEGEVRFTVWTEYQFRLWEKRRDYPILQLTSLMPISLESWHHIAGTYNGKTVKLYINGEIEDSVGILQRSKIWYATYGWKEIRIGQFRDSSFFNGAIDEVRIYNRALNADEIKSLFEKGKS